MTAIVVNAGAVPSRASPGARLAAALVSVACLLMLGIGAWLEPAAEGHGSHTQLGLPPCMWAVTLGKPCPTCGMTTAVSEAAHGHFLRALLVNPFGLLVALAAAVAVPAGLHVALTGSQLGLLLGRALTPRVLWVIAGLALASWAYKWAVWPPR